MRCTQKDVDFITIAWNNVKDASNYDLEMFTPDRNATEYFIAFRRLPQITVKGLTNNTLYRFKVRARSTFGTGNFSEAIVARTLPIGTYLPYIVGVLYDILESTLANECYVKLYHCALKFASPTPCAKMKIFRVP